jgi:regulator of nucleoside diphosphate kinase
MNENPIYISTEDRENLRLRLAGVTAGDARTAKTLARLRGELDRAVVVQTLPPNIVGIESTVAVLDLDTNEVDHYTLTLPERADPARGRLSVLAPLGTALLGYAEGAEIAWEMPGGTRRLRLTRVAPRAEAVGAA